MKKVIQGTLSLLIVALLANWGSEQTTVDGRKKNKINIRGTLETHGLDEQGNPKLYKVNNIAIGKLYERIPVYAKPSPSDFDPVTRMLNVDPASKFLKAYIDLVTDEGRWETAEIRVDQPDVTWKYKKKEYSSEVEYVGITFVSNDEEKTEESYIIDLSKKITCDEINAAGPKEMEVPIQTLKRLTIEGYTHRDSERNETNQSKAIVDGAAPSKNKHQPKNPDFEEEKRDDAE